ncbi:MAG: nuclear transport factor 2 family protein [Hyphomonadaceae bacterium]|nr:nuclear transport factor 2 family protein [Hyphomonadaceae bacterium]
MTLQTPRPINDYFAAKNRHDIDAMLAPFAQNAVVKDEGETMTGRAAIRTWMEETTRKFAVTVAPETLEDAGGRTVVRALVTGNFPGSPLHLSYHFDLRGSEIAALEITL